MKKIKSQEVLPKKPSKAKKVVAAVVIVGVVNLAIKGIAMIASKQKKEVAEDELIFKLRMNGKKADPTNEKKIRRITIDNFMSGMDLDLRNLDLSEGLSIHVKSLMSGICIRVPENIQVESELKLKLSGYSNTIPEYLDESLPSILITGKAYMSGVAIKFID